MNRRDFLKTVLGAGGVGLLGSFALGSGDPDYENSQAVLKELADEVDDTDLASPDETITLPDEMPGKIDEAKVGLESKSTEHARAVASFSHSISEFVSIFPFTEEPPAEPQIEREIRSIDSAITYYESLERYLRTTVEISTDLADVEYTIIEEAESPSALSPDRLQILSSHHSDFEEIDKRLPTENEFLPPLLPERGVTLEETDQLTSVYQSCADAQRKYLDASQKISDGAVHREQGNETDARELFKQAVTRSAMQIPTELRKYRLFEDALTLDDYTVILDGCRTGARKMDQSCEEGEDGNRNELFREGLDAIMQTQETLAWG